jgi:hypothetical protein
VKLLGTINVCFNKRDELLIIYFAFVRYWGKNWEYNETVQQLFMKAYGSIPGDVLYNILMEFVVHMKLLS